MDRLEAMRVFVTAVNESSLAATGRKLSKSAAAVTRAIAFLEARIGTELLHRTTRSIRPSDAGERYAAVCRRVLAELDEAELASADMLHAPRGTLTITAPVSAGETLLLPIVSDYLAANAGVAVSIQLSNRPVNLIDEAVDVALRIAHLSDSALVATRVGEVRRVIAAAPAYLSERSPVRHPADLAAHDIISMTHFGIDRWSFPPLPGSAVPRTVSFAPRLIVNHVRGAVAAAVAGRGLTRLFSYHIADQLRDGSLSLLLADCEHDPLPVHLIVPPGRKQLPKVRAFLDLAAPRLRQAFAELAAIDAVQR